MKDIIKYVLPNKSKFHTISIFTREIIQLENFVVNHFNLKNKTELKDKHEGKVFLDNFLLKAIPILALQKFLKTEILDFSKINVLYFKPFIFINGIRIEIIVCNELLPIVNLNSVSPSILFFSNKLSEISICGFATPDILLENLIDIKTIGIGSKEILCGKFTGFLELKPFKTLDELSKMIL